MCRKRLSSSRGRSELIDSEWVVIVPGQKMHKENANNSVWWGDITDYPGESISDITGLHGLYQIINQPTHVLI